VLIKYDAKNEVWNKMKSDKKVTKVRKGNISNYNFLLIIVLLIVLFIITDLLVEGFPFG